MRRTLTNHTTHVRVNYMQFPELKYRYQERQPTLDVMASQQSCNSRSDRTSSAPSAYTTTYAPSCISEGRSTVQVTFWTDLSAPRAHRSTCRPMISVSLGLARGGTAGVGGVGGTAGIVTTSLPIGTSSEVPNSSGLTEHPTVRECCISMADQSKS